MGVVCKPSEDTVQVPLAKWQGLLHQLPFLLAPHSLLLSSKEILAMPGSCRSRDSMLEPESLDQLSAWKPPQDQTDSSLLVRSSWTDSLKDLTSTSSPSNCPPTLQLPCAIHVFYLLCIVLQLIHKKC